MHSNPICITFVDILFCFLIQQNSNCFNVNICVFCRLCKLCAFVKSENKAFTTTLLRLLNQKSILLVLTFLFFFNCVTMHFTT